MSDSVECNRVNQHHPQRMIERVIIQGEKERNARTGVNAAHQLSFFAALRMTVDGMTLDGKLTPCIARARANSDGGRLRAPLCDRSH
jgi:hypothetical protein